MFVERGFERDLWVILGAGSLMVGCYKKRLGCRWEGWEWFVGEEV